jgi:prepilin-type N-terminal cleavage/methylation domain-containing protein
MNTHAAPPLHELSSESGFTLIETLMALLIFALVGLAAFNVLQKGLAAAAAAEAANTRLAQTQAAWDALASDLAAAAHFRFAPLQGSADSMRFVGLIDSASDTGKLGLISYALEPEASGERRVLVRTARGFRGEQKSEILLPAIRAWRFEYLFKQRQKEQWQTGWANGEILPAAVRVRGVLAAEDKPFILLCPLRAHSAASRRNAD